MISLIIVHIHRSLYLGADKAQVLYSFFFIANLAEKAELATSGAKRTRAQLTPTAAVADVDCCGTCGTCLALGPAEYKLCS